MSRRKIQSNKYLRKKHTVKKQTPVDVLAMNLWQSRAKVKISDMETVEDLIAEGKMDPDQIDDYKYVAGIARELGWSVGRLNEAIELADVRTVIRDKRKVQ